jgi:RNA polymerase sigma-70 factor (ECF subfamily)
MDQIALRKLRRGDEAALERFYEAHVDGLYAFVFYRVGRDKTIAEDVVQGTFLEALDRLDAYDPERASVATWLCVLSRNVIRRNLKSHRRSQELQAMWDRIDETLAQVYAALDHEPLSDEVIEREETRDLVNVTIAHLPERYRDVLEQKYVGGDTLADLAQRMDVSEDAAKSLLARARRAFRDTFLSLSQNVAEGAR